MEAEFKNYRLDSGVITLNDIPTINRDNLLYESQNPYLWSGQYYLLNFFLRENFDLGGYLKFFNWHKGNYVNGQKGLFTRFPYPYAYTNHYDAISFDEQNGLAFASICNKNYRHYNEAVIDYGIANNWTFIDKEFDYPKQTFIDKIKLIYKIIKMAITTKKLGGSGEIDQLIFQDIDLVKLSRRRLPKDSCFLKMLSHRHKPNIIELIHFYLTTLKTIKKPKNSGVNMLVFKFIALYLGGYHSKIISKLRRKFLREVDIMKHINDFYPKNHPFIPYIKKAVDELIYISS